MTSDLTETDYGTLGLALGKCKLLSEIVGDGKFKLCVISKDHIKDAAQKGYITMVLPFGFPDMSNEEVEELMQKLHDTGWSGNRVVGGAKVVMNDRN